MNGRTTALLALMTALTLAGCIEGAGTASGNVCDDRYAMVYGENTTHSAFQEQWEADGKTWIDDDDDCFPNAEESRLGTDPADATDYPQEGAVAAPYAAPYSGEGSGTSYNQGGIGANLNANSPPPFEVPEGEMLTGFTLQLEESSPFDGHTFDWAVRCTEDGRGCADGDPLASGSGAAPLQLEAMDLAVPGGATITMDVTWNRPEPNVNDAQEDRFTITGSFNLRPMPVGEPA